MSQSKNAVELCALLVDEIYGELASRIITILLRRGRLQIQPLIRHTRLTKRQLKHGLSVLIQQHLIYFHETAAGTYYEANKEAAYGLVRSGKILEVVEKRQGTLARDLVHNLFLIGHAKVSDLLIAYEGGSHHATGDLDASNGTTVNGSNGVNGYANGHAPTTARLHSALISLLHAGLISPIYKDMSRSTADLRHEIESKLIKKDEKFLGGAKGPKQKIALKEQVQKEMEELRFERPSWAQPGKKRALDDQVNGTKVTAKRRRIAHADDMDDKEDKEDHDDGEEDTSLLHGLTVHLNYEKITVALRSEELVGLARIRLSPITSQVYGEILRLLEPNIHRCRENTGPDHEDQYAIRVEKIYGSIPKAINVALGFGELVNAIIDTSRLDEPKMAPKRPKAMGDFWVAGTSKPNEKAEEDDESDDTEEEKDLMKDIEEKPLIEDIIMAGAEVGEQEGHQEKQRKQRKRVAKGAKLTPVHEMFTQEQEDPEDPDDPFVEETPANHLATPEEKDECRMEQLKNHLRALTIDDVPFLRMFVENEYTVDFPQLAVYMRNMELNYYLKETFGVEGHRLVRVMQKLGKVEEKQLPYIVLMKQRDIRTKLAEMQMAGMIDIQGIPRDAGHTNARMIFLWHFDEERVKAILLDKIYKAMSRHIQRLDIERRRASGIISLSRRSDVLSGRVTLTETQMKLLSEFRDKESKFIVQLGRLDGLVAVFRDY